MCEIIKIYLLEITVTIAEKLNITPFLNKQSENTSLIDIKKKNKLTIRNKHDLLFEISRQNNRNKSRLSRMNHGSSQCSDVSTDDSPIRIHSTYILHYLLTSHSHRTNIQYIHNLNGTAPHTTMSLLLEKILYLDLRKMNIN